MTTAVEPPQSGSRRGWRSRRVIWPVIAFGVAAYISSYFLLGDYQTGGTFYDGRWITYHDREYGFDPWIYQPVASTEYWLRGPRHQVVTDGRTRGPWNERPSYVYGPRF